MSSFTVPHASPLGGCQLKSERSTFRRLRTVVKNEPSSVPKEAGKGLSTDALKRGRREPDVDERSVRPALEEDAGVRSGRMTHSAEREATPAVSRAGRVSTVSVCRSLSRRRVSHLMHCLMTGLSGLGGWAGVRGRAGAQTRCMPSPSEREQDEKDSEKLRNYRAARAEPVQDF
ncbi:hypothetical protein AAFF_G00166850 [Aldrovandia affinis]|uniref:Uncharacterized protein n=1 Tax=Aldrovandia affinis TaxID=143900 RepID=A0AAD7RPR4_9TELE|nr:hypothetical protein AAFF_G00166850 [Aldrovandia affinis]